MADPLPILSGELKGNLVSPDLVLHSFFEEALVNIAADFNKPITSSVFYYILNLIAYKRFNYYEQAKNLFTKLNGDPDKIEIRRFYDFSRATVPTIHILAPTETEAQKDGIGLGEGYETPQMDETGIVYSFITKTYNSQFTIVISSGSSEATILLILVLKLYMISALEKLSELGFLDPTIQIMDIVPTQDMIPAVFQRSIEFSFWYEISMPNIFTFEYQDIFIDKGIPKIE